jgi:hypothetical protein
MSGGLNIVQDVEYPENRATRIGPFWFFRRAGEGVEAEEWPVFLPHLPRVKIVASLIRLQHAHVVQRCRSIGLLPPASVAPTEPRQHEPLVPQTGQDQKTVREPKLKPGNRGFPYKPLKEILEHEDTAYLLTYKEATKKDETRNRKLRALYNVKAGYAANDTTPSDTWFNENVRRFNKDKQLKKPRQ